MQRPAAISGGAKFILLLQKQNQFLRKQNQFPQKQSTWNDSASRSNPECIPLRSKDTGSKISLFRNQNQFPTGFQKQNNVFRKQNGKYSGIKISYSGIRINFRLDSRIKIKYPGSKMELSRNQNKLFRKKVEFFSGIDRN